MSSWLSIILLLLVIITVAYFYLRRANKLPSWLSHLTASNPDKTIESLQAQTAAELEKMVELRKVLEAKKALSEAKAANTYLRKQIANTKQPVGIPKQLLEVKHNGKVKA